MTKNIMKLRNAYLVYDLGIKNLHVFLFIVNVKHAVFEFDRNSDSM